MNKFVELFDLVLDFLFNSEKLSLESSKCIVLSFFFSEKLDVRSTHFKAEGSIDFMLIIGNPDFHKFDTCNHTYI